MHPWQAFSMHTMWPMLGSPRKEMVEKRIGAKSMAPGVVLLVLVLVFRKYPEVGEMINQRWVKTFIT